MKTSGDNHYSLSKIHKIFISLSVFLRKIWFWHCQKRNWEYYESLHPLYSNVTCYITTLQIQKSPLEFAFPRFFPVTNGTIAFSLFPRIGWYFISPKKVLLWCQNTFYNVLSISLVCHVPGTMPSLPIFPYLHSTHRNESNCIYYMVVSNQHLSTKNSLTQHMLKWSFFSILVNYFNIRYLFWPSHVNAYYFEFFLQFYFTGFGEELSL